MGRRACETLPSLSELLRKGSGLAGRSAARVRARLQLAGNAGQRRDAGADTDDQC
jgi:hypothetical protein